MSHGTRCPNVFNWIPNLANTGKHVPNMTVQRTRCRSSWAGGMRRATGVRAARAGTPCACAPSARRRSTSPSALLPPRTRTRFLRAVERLLLGDEDHLLAGEGRALGLGGALEQADEPVVLLGVAHRPHAPVLGRQPRRRAMLLELRLKVGEFLRLLRGQIFHLVDRPSTRRKLAELHELDGVLEARVVLRLELVPRQQRLQRIAQVLGVTGGISPAPALSPRAGAAGCAGEQLLRGAKVTSGSRPAIAL
eukprot:scaffold15541_cov36-Phaeocystis_antarctica.AAC.2